MDNDTLILYGGDVKAKGDGKVEGYLVLFGDKNNHDLSSKKDYFDDETDFDLGFTTKSRVYYQHGLDKTLGNLKLGTGEMKQDEVGIWIDAQLDLRQEYIADVKQRKQMAEFIEAIYADLAAKGACGWSSGVPAHLVRRERQDNGANHVQYWPLGLDASLTPNPADDRTEAVVSIKSLADMKSSGLSMSTKQEILQRALLAKLKSEAGSDEEYVYGWICDVFDTTLVYNSYGKTSGCFEAAYTIDGVSATIGTEKAVQRLVSYKPLPYGTKSLVVSEFTERDCERYLREAGFSHAVSAALSREYKALRQRDAEEPPNTTPDTARHERLRELNQRHLALKHFQLQHGIHS